MKRTLLIVLVLCTLSAIAAVPRLKRAINSDEEENNAPTPADVEICAPQTPCAWLVYKQSSKIITETISNTYCKCGIGFVCDKRVDDTSSQVYIVKCQAVTPES